MDQSQIVVTSRNPMFTDAQANRFRRRIDALSKEYRLANGKEPREKALVDLIIADAKDPHSVLHGAYNWDKNAVFIKYLRRQTRAIIQAIYWGGPIQAKDAGPIRYYEDVQDSNRKGKWLRNVPDAIATSDKVVISEIRRRLHDELLVMYSTYRRYEGVIPNLAKLKDLSELFK